jgi:hypothetical protein
MVKVKAKDDKTYNVYVIICRDLEKIMGSCIKIFRVSGYQTELDKEEIKKVEGQEYHNRTACPYHEFRKE